MSISRSGGIAALVAAATYVVGFALFATVLSPTADMMAGEFVEFLGEHRAVFYLWNFVIYVVNGVVLVGLALALHHRLKKAASGLMQAATAVGLIWAGLVIASGMLMMTSQGAVLALNETDPAGAATLWRAVDAVKEGLGGGIEIPGALWVLLISAGASRMGRLPRGLNLLGAVTGLAGLLTVIPDVDVFESVFGLGLLVWFIGAGIVLLRTSETSTPVSMTAPATTGHR